MKSRRFALRFVCFMFGLGVLAAAAPAAPEPAPPLLEDQAVVVVRVDLERIDVDAAADWVVALLKSAELEGEELKRVTTDVRSSMGALDAWLGGMKTAGARKVYYVLS